jgi:hypothetical protein
MTSLIVVTDQLSKGAIFIPLLNTTTDIVVWKFLERVVAYYRLPNAITLD